jgi:hypothetical protein
VLLHKSGDPISQGLCRGDVGVNDDADGIYGVVLSFSHATNSESSTST